MSIRKRIIFDQSQNERGRLDSTYSHLGKLLREQGYDIEPYTEYMILPKKIQEADVIVFGCPNSSKLRPPEIDTLKRFVREGGGLLLLSLSGGDRGLMNNLSQLSKTFDITFENTAVKDEQNNAGTPTMVIIRDIVQHEVTDNVRDLLIPAACTLRVAGEAKAIAHTSPVADPASQPVIAVAEYGEGRVIGIGSYEIFRNSGLKNEGNRQLAINAFRWLCAQEELVKPSEVREYKETSATSLQGTTTHVRAAPSEIEKTMRNLVGTIFDLKKEVDQLNEKLEIVSSNIESLREQFKGFAETVQQQLGLIVPAKQFQSESEDKAEQLELDIAAIEKEIGSVKQLRDLIEQKHAAGTMSAEVFEEQKKKLDDRLQNLEKRLKKKKKELKELKG